MRISSSLTVNVSAGKLDMTFTELLLEKYKHVQDDNANMLIFTMFSILV